MSICTRDVLEFAQSAVRQEASQNQLARLTMALARQSRVLRYFSLVSHDPVNCGAWDSETIFAAGRLMATRLI
jgi:hypothetical protein